MNAHTRKARWLALTAGLIFMGGGILTADVSPLDPEIFQDDDITILYSTYLGGSRSEFGEGIAVDDQGNVYITGSTSSPDLPGTPTGPSVPPHPPYRLSPVFLLRPWDGFVSRLDPSGRLAYSAYVGDAPDDRARGIAVSSSSVHVVGTGVETEGSNVFLARLDHHDPYGSYTFEYLPGGRWARGNGIAVTPGGTPVATGCTIDLSYYDETNPYRSAAFIGTYGAMKLDGMGMDEGLAIQINATGTYVTGWTGSPDFPVVNAFQETYGGGDLDVFVTKPGSYTTYLGGNGWEDAKDIAVTPAGEVYVTGTTSSADFPITADALDAVLDGPGMMYLTKLDASGALAYSTYLGGYGTESVEGIAIDPAGGVLLVGSSLTPDSPFLDPDRPDCRENFLARLDLQAGTIRSVCIPSAHILDLAVDRYGNIYLTGQAIPGFPAVNAFQSSPSGYSDAFVAKVRFNRPPDCSAASASPSVIWPPNGKLVPVAIHGVTDPDGDPVILAVTGIRQDEPLTRAGVPDATGLDTPGPQVRADRKGGGDGRVYHLAFEARDDKGATCIGTVKVCVPHDRRAGAACGDGGPLIDSE